MALSVKILHPDRLQYLESSPYCHHERFFLLFDGLLGLAFLDRVTGRLGQGEVATTLSSLVDLWEGYRATVIVIGATPVDRDIVGSISPQCLQTT